MAHKDWCKKPCHECPSPCGLDKNIPCRPDCDNLKTDGTVDYSRCIEAKCDNVANYACCNGELVDPDEICDCCDRYSVCERIELMNTLKDAIHGRKASSF